MKKIVFIIVILAILVAGGVFATNKLNTEKSNAIVMASTSNVEFSTDGSSFETITEETHVQEGSHIRTDSAGTAAIILADNSIITMEPDTQIQLTELPTSNRHSTRINQLVGNTWHRVESVTGGGNYEVETSSVVAAVRGTSFGVETQASDEYSNIIVTESDVTAYPKDDDNKRLDPVEVRTNQYFETYRSEIQQERIQNAREITQEIRTRAWIVRNSEIDSNLRNITDRNEVYRNPRILRERLQIPERIENIRENIDDMREDLDLGSRDITSEGLNGMLLEFDDWTQVCASINALDTTTLSAGLEITRQYYGDYADKFMDYLNSAQSYCRDGELNDREIESLTVMGEELSSYFETFQNQYVAPQTFDSYDFSY
jgi:hypothetical protein